VVVRTLARVPIERLLPRRGQRGFATAVHRFVFRDDALPSLHVERNEALLLREVVESRMLTHLATHDQTTQVAVAEAAAVVEMLHPVECREPLVRVGAPRDGGYLVPDVLASVTDCFSPGVADASHFEAHLAERGIRCFLADGSVVGPAAAHPLITFERVWLGGHDDATTTTLASWMRRHVPETARDLLLQMDIEGAEYETLLATPRRELGRFSVIVVELHHLEDLLWDPNGRGGRIKDTLERLALDFRVAHLHPNNCMPQVSVGGLTLPSVMEATFVRPDLAPDPVRFRRDFPHALDADNFPPPLRPLVLPSCWQGAETRAW
jgi:hypothetical protein